MSSTDAIVISEGARVVNPKIRFYARNRPQERSSTDVDGNRQ